MQDPIGGVHGKCSLKASMQDAILYPLHLSTGLTSAVNFDFPECILVWTSFQLHVLVIVSSEFSAFRQTHQVFV